MLASKIFFFFQNIYPKQVVCLSRVWQEPALIAIGIHNEGKHWIIGRHKSCWNFSSEASAIFPSSTLFPWWLIRSPSSFLHLLSTSYIHSNRWCCYCCAPLLQLNKEPWSKDIFHFFKSVHTQRRCSWNSWNILYQVQVCSLSRCQPWSSRFYCVFMFLSKFSALGI